MTHFEKLLFCIESNFNPLGHFPLNINMYSFLSFYVFNVFSAFNAQNTLLNNINLRTVAEANVIESETALNCFLTLYH